MDSFPNPAQLIEMLTRAHSQFADGVDGIADPTMREQARQTAEAMQKALADIATSYPQTLRELEARIQRGRDGAEELKRRAAEVTAQIAAYAAAAKQQAAAPPELPTPPPAATPSVPPPAAPAAAPATGDGSIWRDSGDAATWNESHPPVSAAPDPGAPIVEYDRPAPPTKSRPPVRPGEQSGWTDVNG